MITTLATEWIAIWRPTSFVLSGEAVSASLAPNAQPPRSSIVEVEVYDVDGTGAASGIVTVTGSLAGDPVSEALAMAVGSFAQTVQRFDLLTSFGFAGGLLSAVPAPYARARAIGPGGEPQSTARLVVSGWPAHLEDARVGWSGGAEGLDATSVPVALIDYAETWAPLIGDLLVAESGAEFLVRGVRVQRSPTRPTHWTLYLAERGDSL